jgi:hypothetical protein
MPPVDLTLLPASLLARFSGPTAESLMHCLVFLTPLSVGWPITLREGR